MRAILVAALLLLIPYPGTAGLPTIAVADFTSNDPTELVIKIPDFLSDELVNTGLFSVVEREGIASILREQDF